ncbi:uncharacterized protein LOC130894470 [Diorhabda carinulata]|uniref:uncharacterized protein LOC130894470 n=1 Tax=Diorhabda carinulata TaxID=1163345 RepID=UPI0025A287B5|nr:uncharacterized protein LOC130894470 [Diorhabda carinulata]
MAVSPLCIIKIFELLIAIVCMALHCHSRTGDLDIETVSIIAFGGYIIILAGEALGYFLGCPFDKKIDIFYSIVGCFMFIAAGALNIDTYDGYFKSDVRDYGLSKGSLAIIDAFLFLVDAVLTYKGKTVTFE